MTALSQEDRGYMYELHDEHGVSFEDLAEKFECTAADARRAVDREWLRRMPTCKPRQGRSSPFTRDEIMSFLVEWVERPEYVTADMLRSRFWARTGKKLYKNCATMWVKRYIKDRTPIVNACRPTDGIDTDKPAH